VAKQQVRRRPARRPSDRRRRPPTSGVSVWLWALVAVALAAAFAFWLTRDDGEGADERSKAFVGGDLHSLIVDPADPRTVYVGGHEAVSVSRDGGRTWERIPTLDDADAMGWAFIDGAVVVGGHPGLSVSEDGGRTFERRNEGLPATDIHSLGGAGETLYAASPAAGVLRSVDAGRTWAGLTSEVGQSFMGPILVDPTDPEHLVASDMSAGVAESRDGGRTWRALGGLQGTMWVSWDPGDPRHLIASGAGGAAESVDGGATWNRLDIPVGGLFVTMSPHDPRTLFAAGHEGSEAQLSVSRDGGATWGPP
jgi:photosystem II stability/assembly factor-like uncharacterized protein